MLRALELEDSELSILLCDDETIRELNRRYRAQDKPTDVLAFAMREGQPMQLSDEGTASMLGDVVISLPTATRQARERGRRIVQEVTFLLAHGLLHLIGYDHLSRDEERRMSAMTDVLLAAVEAARRTR
jgi:probable rRNA maturation factor